ncbi:MAG TPA: putative metallopeptidase [Blastocatellia bacterium]|nr:putative metallopeptidase [Blastocatellia bacterium]
MPLQQWIEETFINQGATLYNEDHQHLQGAMIGCLWSNVPNNREMRTVLATAEIFNPKGNAWQKARQENQLLRWFGDIPDFIITVFAPYAVEADEASFCALIEHELYHCAQRTDADGSPKFKSDGSPAYGIKGHDVEEFTGVVRRYGVDAAQSGVGQLVAAAKMKPILSGAKIKQACGTCALRAV